MPGFNRTLEETLQREYQPADPVVPATVKALQEAKEPLHVRFSDGRTTLVPLDTAQAIARLYEGLGAAERGILERAVRRSRRDFDQVVEFALNEGGMLSIGAEGLRRLTGNEILVQPNHEYFMGASSDPKHIVVTKVDDKWITYYAYPYVTAQRIDKVIGTDLIATGVQTWLKSGYNKYSPDLARALQTALQGKPSQRSVDLEQFQYITVSIAPGDGFSEDDMYSNAKAIGVIGGGGDNYTLNIQRQQLPDLQAMPEVKVLAVLGPSRVRESKTRKSPQSFGESDSPGMKGNPRYADSIPQKPVNIRRNGIDESITEAQVGSVVFRRMGNFYETFGGDAEIVARVMGDTARMLTSGPFKGQLNYGVPYHALARTQDALSTAGYTWTVTESKQAVTEAWSVRVAIPAASPARSHEVLEAWVAEAAPRLGGTAKLVDSYSMRVSFEARESADALVKEAVSQGFIADPPVEVLGESINESWDAQKVIQAAKSGYGINSPFGKLRVSFTSGGKVKVVLDTRFDVTGHPNGSDAPPDIFTGSSDAAADWINTKFNLRESIANFAQGYPGQVARALSIVGVRAVAVREEISVDTARGTVRLNLSSDDDGWFFRSPVPGIGGALSDDPNESAQEIHDQLNGGGWLDESTTLKEYFDIKPPRPFPMGARVSYATDRERGTGVVIGAQNNVMPDDPAAVVWKVKTDDGSALWLGKAELMAEARVTATIKEPLDEATRVLSNTLTVLVVLDRPLGSRGSSVRQAVERVADRYGDVTNWAEAGRAIEIVMNVGSMGGRGGLDVQLRDLEKDMDAALAAIPEFESVTEATNTFQKGDYIKVKPEALDDPREKDLLYQVTSVNPRTSRLYAVALGTGLSIPPENLFGFEMVRPASTREIVDLSEAKEKVLLWMRLGDSAEYEQFGSDLGAAAEALSGVLRLASETGESQDVIDTVRWRDQGLEAGPFDGQNYVSLFWGDDDAQPARGLDRGEQVAFIKALRGRLKESK